MVATPQPWRLGRRSGLDGLRGVAILFVLVNHTGIALFGKAGAVGVNVFFVLSGFLITRLIIDERDSLGKVSLKKFYIRRSLRLFPAMYAYLTVTALVALATDRSLMPIFYAGTYVLNIAKSAGMDTHLVTHTWTLSMEEQFYLLWPGILLLSISRRSGQRASIALALVGIALSMTLRVLTGLSGYSLVYLHNSPLLGLGVLLVGCFLALVAEHLPKSALVHPSVFASSCATLIVASLGPKTTFLYIVGVPAVSIASAAIVAYLVQDEQNTLINRVMTWQPLAALGRISYGLYLWHYLVFFLVKLTYDDNLGVRIAFQVSASLIIAILSYRYLEQPFLRMKDRYARDAGPSPSTSALANTEGPLQNCGFNQSRVDERPSET